MCKGCGWAEVMNDLACPSDKGYCLDCCDCEGH